MGRKLWPQDGQQRVEPQNPLVADPSVRMYPTLQDRFKFRPELTVAPLCVQEDRQLLPACPVPVITVDKTRTDGTSAKKAEHRLSSTQAVQPAHKHVQAGGCADPENKHRNSATERQVDDRWHHPFQDISTQQCCIRHQRFHCLHMPRHIGLDDLQSRPVHMSSKAPNELREPSVHRLQHGMALDKHQSLNHLGCCLTGVLPPSFGALELLCHEIGEQHVPCRVRQCVQR
mmetsp:Transcript_3654/g.10506  ORF Transcript_3654/g.10506 Transcript_3654/m.10506 type:complete len:230 (+) Transcript_3654:452-1141(+)